MAWYRSLWFLVYQSLRCHVLINHRIFLVLVIGGRHYVQPSRRQFTLGMQAVYIYTLPIWWLYATYHLLQPENKSVWIKLSKKKHSKRYELRRVSKGGRCLRMEKKHEKKARFFLVGLVGKLTPSQTGLFLEYKPSEVFQNASTEHVRHVNLFKPLFTYIRSLTFLNSTWFKRKRTIYCISMFNTYIIHMIYIYTYLC